jgi:hypothetical protein
MCPKRNNTQLALLLVYKVEMSFKDCWTFMIIAGALISQLKASRGPIKGTVRHRSKKPSQSEALLDR